MCFSASASFIAGGTLSTVGVLTIKKTKKKSEIPFATIPFLFAIQQVIEGVLWIAIRYNIVLIQTIATFLFSLFAYALWPAFLPFSLRLLEPLAQRKKLLNILQFVGLAVGIYLLYFIIKFPVTCSIVNYSIRYADSVPFGYQMFWLYAVAGVGSCFVSSHRIINLFGMLLVLSIVVAYSFYSFAFVSVWCFFAALLSLLIYFFFISTNKSQISFS